MKNQMLNADALMNSLRLLIIQHSAPGREMQGALGLLERYRVQSDNSKIDMTLNTSIEEELSQLLEEQAKIAEVKKIDTKDASKSKFAPLNASAVENIFRSRMPKSSSGHIANLRTIEGGYSKQTTLFDWIYPDKRIEQFVLRRDARLKHIGTTVQDEYPLVKSLYKLGFPVAEPLFLEANNPDIPEPFIVMRQLEGQALGGPMGVGEDKGFDPIPALAKVLAELHAIPVFKLNVQNFSEKNFDKNELREQINYWKNRYYNYREARSPTLEMAFEFLIKEVESGIQNGVIVHGDCDLYNLLFDDGEFVALLDWEMAHLGSPAWDLSYVKSSVENFCDYETFLTLYEGFGGIRPPVQALQYYNIFRLVRGVVMCVAGISLFNKGEPIGLDLVNVNYTLYAQFLEQLPDLINTFEGHTCNENKHKE